MTADRLAAALAAYQHRPDLAACGAALARAQAEEADAALLERWRRLTALRDALADAAAAVGAALGGDAALAAQMMLSARMAADGAFDPGSEDAVALHMVLAAADPPAEGAAA